MNPILSIIIVEYYSIQEVCDCVEVLKRQISVPYEIIISSNSCYDERQRQNIVADEHVRWLFNAHNEGFAHAMNNGMDVASGRYMVIMNSDCTLLTPLQGMIDFMDEHPEVGAIAPKMIDSEGNLQDTARPYVTLPRFIGRQLKRIVCHKASLLNPYMDYAAVQTVDWVIGAFIMVSRATYNATGGFDLHYFMYAEDLDWCTRIRMEGLEVVYFPKVELIYKGTRRARKSLKYARIFMHSHLRYWWHFGFFSGHPKRKNIVYSS